MILSPSHLLLLQKHKNLAAGIMRSRIQPSCTIFLKSSSETLYHCLIFKTYYLTQQSLYTWRNTDFSSQYNNIKMIFVKMMWYQQACIGCIACIEYSYYTYQQCFQIEVNTDFSHVCSIQHSAGLDKHLKCTYGCSHPYTYPSDSEWATKSSLVSTSFRLEDTHRVTRASKAQNLCKCETNLELGGENLNCNQFQEYFHYNTGIWRPLEIIPGDSRKLKNGCWFKTQISHPTLSSPQDSLLLVARFLPPSDFPSCTLTEITLQMGSPAFILTPINYINHMLLFFY